MTGVANFSYVTYQKLHHFLPSVSLNYKKISNIYNIYKKKCIVFFINQIRDLIEKKNILLSIY